MNSSRLNEYRRKRDVAPILACSAPPDFHAIYLDMTLGSSTCLRPWNTLWIGLVKSADLTADNILIDEESANMTVETSSIQRDQVKPRLEEPEDYELVDYLVSWS